MKSESESEPHTIALPMGKLTLLANNAKPTAKKVLDSLRAGKHESIDSLEILDEILIHLTALEEHCLQIDSGMIIIDVKMAKRLRFKRGLDIRPTKALDNCGG